MNDTELVIAGNLTSDPEIKYLANGAAVVNFTIAATPRTYDKQAGQFVDGEALFMRCSAWRQLAENISETLQRGHRVIAQGRLKQRSYEKDGQTRSVIELEVDEIGPSLKFATASVTKAQRGGGNGQQRSSSDDPWATASVGASGGGGSYEDDSPPF